MAVILAAGSGQRLMPLTKENPKTLLPVANTPILDYVISALERAGLTKIAIATGYRGAKIVEYLEATKKHRTTQIKCVNAAKHRRGPLYSLLAMEKIVEDDFLLAPGDLIMAHGIVTKLLRNYRKGSTVYAAMDFRAPKANVVPVCCCGASNSQSGSVLGFGNAMRARNYESENRTFLGTSVGTVICPVGIFEQAHSASRDGSTKVVDALNRFINEGGRGRYVKVGVRDYWFDVDSIETMLAANKFILEKSLIVDKSRGKFYRNKATLQSKAGGYDLTNLTARVIGPVITGENCAIGNGSTIGPYVSMQDGCVVGSQVRCENAILLRNSHVRNCMTIIDAIVHNQEIINVKKNSQATIRR